MSTRKIRNWIIFTALVGIFVFLVLDFSLWQKVLEYLFPEQSLLLYPGANLAQLVGQHLVLVGISSGLTACIGIPLGIWVTRPSGRDFLPIVSTATSFGQTFPPVAVLALSVPALGFGILPTIAALFIYGLLPVVRNTISGISAVDPDVLEASSGMGMSHFQKLTKVEFPLALPIILAGIRISVIINIGTAMIGATIGSGGLGAPIISGLVQNNLSLVIEGALPGALLAILLDFLFNNIEDSVTKQRT
jgi:osmoprotectant transport system permease protein